MVGTFNYLCLYFLTNILLHFIRFCSKSEYVRCLQFTEQNTLYVSTNNGFLYHVDISDPKNAKWTQLIQVNEEIAIICMDVTERGFVALGDGKGNVTVLKVSDEGESGAKVDLSFTWSAEKERQLLGVFWCKSLGSRYVNMDSNIFTSIDIFMHKLTCLSMHSTLLSGLHCFNFVFLCGALTATFLQVIQGVCSSCGI